MRRSLLALISMMSSPGRLCLLWFLSVVSAEFQQAHPEVSRSIAVASSAVLADVGEHDKSAGRRIEKLQQGGHDRIDVDSEGTTMMEGVSLGEASGHSPAGLIRRESNSGTHRAAAALGGSAELEERRANAGEKTQAKKAKRVTWAACTGGKCTCTSRRRTVIRYKRETLPGASSHSNQANAFTNWYHRSRDYIATPTSESTQYIATNATHFDRGFTTNAHNLQMCGGDTANSKDCLTQPTACTFDTTDTNTYDAKAGEYCCDSALEYCSYRCTGVEEFKCPSSTLDINFPGGMDPAGPTVFKKCYIAQYPHGSNPEAAADGNEDAVTDDT